MKRETSREKQLSSFHGRTANVIDQSSVQTMLIKHLNAECFFPVQITSVTKDTQAAQCFQPAQTAVTKKDPRVVYMCRSATTSPSPSFPTQTLTPFILHYRQNVIFSAFLQLQTVNEESQFYPAVVTQDL